MLILSISLPQFPFLLITPLLCLLTGLGFPVTGVIQSALVGSLWNGAWFFGAAVRNPALVMG